LETPALPGRVAVARGRGRRKLAPSGSHLGRVRNRARAGARVRIRVGVRGRVSGRVRVRAGARRTAPAGTVALPSAVPRPD